MAWLDAEDNLTDRRLPGGDDESGLLAEIPRLGGPRLADALDVTHLPFPPKLLVPKQHYPLTNTILLSERHSA